MSTIPELYYVISCEYSNDKSLFYLKLYNPKTEEVTRYYDKTGYMPYLFTNWSIQDVKQVFRENSIKAEVVSKYNLLLEREEKYTKVSGKDPTQIIGNNRASVKSIIEERNGLVWEGRVKHTHSYIFDKNIEVGMPYYFHKTLGLIPWIDEKSENKVNIIGERFKDQDVERKEAIKTWTRFFEYVAPYSKRAALDIEVLKLKGVNRVPDPNVADRPVHSIAFWTSEGRKIVLILELPNMPFNIEGLEECELIRFKDEAELLRFSYCLIRNYPFIITFNGDEFDLPYLRKRGTNLGIPSIEIPITVREKATYITTGIHIDLYKFFNVRAIQIYAFQAKYKNVSLDELGETLLGKPKLKHEKDFDELSYTELANYNLRDAEITYELTSFNKDIVMNLIWLISRIARLPMEDASRLAVSGWIKSFIFLEHRKQNCIIPKSDEIKNEKGVTSTISMIKGKKYKGAIVVDPVTGIHFGVVVVDFQSLYPSIMKYHNIGYRTINCKNHGEKCDKNKVPSTTHHLCVVNQAMESILIGSLKDLRVEVYKGKGKDKTLDEDVRAWYSTVEQTVKVIMNASYGVFGSDSFDLYCAPVAESIASIARFDTTNIIEQSKVLHITVLYGDTDSTFLKQPTKEQIEALCKWAMDNLHMDLAVDKKYRYVCLSNRKKNYFGVFEDEVGKDGKVKKGEVDIKGLTGKKKHTPKIIKDNFNQIKKILQGIYKEEDFPQAKEEIKKTIKKTYGTIKRREWTDISEMSFKMSLGKDVEGYVKNIPQHVQAAKQLQESGREIKSGEEIEFVKVIKPQESAKKKSLIKKLSSDHKYKSSYPSCKPVQLVKNEEIDVSKYLNFLKNTCIQILEAIDLDWEQDIEGITHLF